MAKLSTNIPVGKSEKINVAVMRPNVNVREAENVGEQAAAEVAHLNPTPVQFSKHASFVPTKHPVERMFED
jgi:hypothetical protein